MRKNPDVVLRGDHNECPTCGELFNSSKAFEKHRTGDHAGGQRRCLSIEAMQAIGMAKNADGWWVTELREPV
jgi:hypothetical protein